MEDIFFTTNNQKVLRFLARHPTQSLLASEIREALNISRAGVNFALQDLSEKELIRKESKGKAYVYQIKTDLAVLKQYKVLDVIIKLQPLVGKLENYANKIILFGSCARGEDTEDSDIDLLITTHNKDEVKEGLEQFKTLPLKSIIKTPIEFENLQKKDPSLYSEINRGIILLEENE